MICPKCGSKKISVSDSRPSMDDNSIRRRRECEDCGYRFTTYEQTRSDLIKTAKAVLRTELFIALYEAMGNVFDKNADADTSPFHDLLP